MAKAAVATTDHEQTSTAIAQITSGPQRLVEFVKETRAEMHKVVTPSRMEVRNTTIIVLATVFFFAAFFEVVDIVLGQGIDKLFLHLTGH
jgi:preprotein translocase subunit SecE